MLLMCVADVAVSQLSKPALRYCLWLRRDERLAVRGCRPGVLGAAQLMAAAAAASEAAAAAGGSAMGMGQPDASMILLLARNRRAGVRLLPDLMPNEMEREETRQSMWRVLPEPPPDVPDAHTAARIEAGLIFLLATAGLGDASSAALKAYLQQLEGDKAEARAFYCSDYGEIRANALVVELLGALEQLWDSMARRRGWGHDSLHLS